MIALSWSRLTTYLQCPKKFHLQFITKSFPEEEKSIHLIKGEQLHKQLEDYVLAKNGAAPMPLGFSPEVRESLPYVDKLFTLYERVYPEAQVACTPEWTTTEWFDRSVGWRAIWDVIGLRSETCFIGDYKSGKIYPLGDDFGQLHLSAAMALKRFSDVPEVRTAYIYIEHKKVTPVKVTRHPTDELDARGKPVPHLQQVIEYFDRRFEQVQREVEWAPTPNDYCKWCPATKAVCKYSRKL